MAHDPLEQSYLVVQKSDQYFLLPMMSNYPVSKQQSSSLSIQPSNSETTSVAAETKREIKTELLDDSSNGNISDQLTLPNNSDKLQTKVESVFICHICRKFYNSNQDLIHHISTHSDVRIHKCPVCNRLLKTKRTLRFHMKIHEDNGELYHCADCDFKSKRPASVKRHQIRIHTNSYQFSCPQCPKMFNLHTDFKKHTQKHLNNVCQCDVCGKSCKNEYYLHIHKRSHKIHQIKSNYVMPEKMEVKKQEESVKSELVTLERQENHREDDHDHHDHNDDVRQIPKKWKRKGRTKMRRSSTYQKCPQCKWCFRTTYLLEKHMQRHLLSFNCNACDAVFKYRASFLKHKATHNKGGKLRCKLDNASLSDSTVVSDEGDKTAF